MKRNPDKILYVLFFAIFAALIILGLGKIQGKKDSFIANQQSYAYADAKVFRLDASTGFYQPNEIRVRVGDKVRIEAIPDTFVGCMSTFIIDGYGISKYITSKDYMVEFVADKSGTFNMHCPMGMGAGKLIVEDENGYAAPSQTPMPSSSCGSLGTGCGCGRS